MYGSGDDKANDGKQQSFRPLNQDLYGYFGRDGIWVDDSLPVAGITEGQIFSSIGHESQAGLGLIALNLGVEVTLAMKHTLFADLSYFSAVTTGGLETVGGTSNIATDLGIEGNVGVLFRWYRNLHVTVNYAAFQPGSFFKDYYGSQADSLAHNFFMEALWRF